jgi:hypothetical protein
MVWSEENLCPIAHVQGVRLNHTIFTWEARSPIVANDIPL